MCARVKWILVSSHKCWKKKTLTMKVIDSLSENIQKSFWCYPLTGNDICARFCETLWNMAAWLLKSCWKTQAVILSDAPVWNCFDRFDISSNVENFFFTKSVVTVKIIDINLDHADGEDEKTKSTLGREVGEVTGESRVTEACIAMHYNALQCVAFHFTL